MSSIDVSGSARVEVVEAECKPQCFVPEILVECVEKLVEQGEKNLEPFSYSLNGVCLLVDISGFTRLSEGYCAKGRDGIYELRRTTNEYMGRLVDIIYGYDGDIIKFAGDAMICLFHAKSDLNEFNRARRASTLGLDQRRGSALGLSPEQLQQLQTQQDPSLSRLSDSTSYQPPSVSVDQVLQAVKCAAALREVQALYLTVHVAISCGEICFGILGGYKNRWECLISGSCLHQLSSCLDDAPSTEAALTPECFEVLRCASEDSNQNYLSMVGR